MTLELSSDDTSVLELLRPGSLENTPQKRTARSSPKPRPKRARNPPKKHFYESSDDEFAVEVPSVFQIDGKLNEKLVKNSILIDETISEDAANMKRQYAQLIDQKEALLAELNDNGSTYLYLLSNDQHVRLVDSLIKLGLQRKGPFLASRHFYFYGAMLKDHGLNTDLPFNPNSSLFKLQFRRRNHESLKSLLARHFLPFLNHILVNETDVRFLLAVNEFVSSLESASFASITTAQFSRYVEILGGNTKLLSPATKLPIKLVSYNNTPRLLYLRLAILFHSALSLETFETGLYFQLLRVLILTLSDFNLIKRDVCGFTDIFVGPVFSALVQWRCKGVDKPPLEQHDSLVLEFNSMISDVFVTRFHSGLETPSKLVSYQLHFNLLRLLTECAASSSDLFVARLVASLNMSFVKGEEYFSAHMTEAERDLETRNFDYTPSTETLLAVLQKVRKLNVAKALEQNAPDPIDKIYVWPYRLRALNLVIYKTFCNNLNTGENKRNHREITSANYNRLSKLNLVVKAARDKFHGHLGQVLHAETPDGCIYEREDVVAAVTESYYVLNEISATLTKDALLVHEDIFYDGVE